MLALLLSGRPHRRRARSRSFGRGTWDAERRRSYVRLDRVLELAEDGLRREGAVLAPGPYERVSAELRRRRLGRSLKPPTSAVEMPARRP